MRIRGPLSMSHTACERKIGAMLGLTTLPCQQSTASLPFLNPISIRFLPALPLQKVLKFQSQVHRNRTRFKVFSGQNDNGLGKNLKEAEGGRNGGNSGDDLRKERGLLFNIKWGELLLDPDPDNILAVALTGLLAWASVQVLWQLFFISLAILVAALKYSFIAALLIFILITLL